MIEQLRPYPAYKDSGLPWLGQVPAHWRVQRLKTVLQEVDHRSPDGSGTLLSLSRSRGLIRRRDVTEKVHSAKTLVGYKQYRPGQIVMNRMQAWSGLFGAGGEAGLVSPDYAVFDVRATENVKLILERLKNPDMVAQFALESTGIGSGFNRLYSDRLGAIPVSLAPAEEQAAIVRFLDHATHRLDKAIRAKRKTIALLNEQKQAIIHRAVTRGLAPDAPLKDSGIPWLGQIPAHWEIRRAKQLCRAIVDCKNRTPDMIPEGGFSVIRTTNVRNGRFSMVGSYPTDKRNFDIWTERGAPRVGDVFFTREAPAGEACLVPDIPNICMGQRMMYFRPDPAVLDSAFLLHSIYGPVGRTYIDNACNGSTVGHLRLGQVSALPLLWCPIEEQGEIISHIGRESVPIETTSIRIEREIDLLREYRTRLIADVVTGKLDVREAAARLPEIEPIDAVSAEEPDDTEADEPVDALAEVDA